MKIESFFTSQNFRFLSSDEELKERLWRVDKGSEGKKYTEELTTNYISEKTINKHEFNEKSSLL
jgi:hypothetical protein